MRSTYYKSAIFAASTSYLSTPATSIDIGDYTQDIPLEDDSTNDWISSSEADANITLAQDWRAELLAQTEVMDQKHYC